MNPRVQDLESKGFRPLSSLPGGTVPAATQFASGMAAGTPSTAPQAAIASPFTVQAPQVSAQAFPSHAIQSPFEAVQAAPGFPVPVAARPEAAVPPAASATPTGLPGSALPAFRQVPVEPSHEAPAPVASGDGRFELSVREVLLDVPQDRLGFDPSRVPGDVMARFPFSLIMPQLSAGRVEVRLLDVVEGCAEKYRPAFAKSDMEASVTLPIESIFHQLPMEPGPAAPAACGPFPAVEIPVPSPWPPAPAAEAPPSVFPSDPVPAAPFAAVPVGGLGEAAAGFGTQAPTGYGLSAFHTPFSGAAAADAGQPLPVAPASGAPSPFGLPPTPVAAPEARVESKPASLWDSPLSPTSAVPPSGASSAFGELQPLGGFPSGTNPYSTPAPAPSASPFLGEAEGEAGVAPNENSFDHKPSLPWGAPAPQGAGAFSVFGAPAFEDDAVEAFESLGSAADVVEEPPSIAIEAFEPVGGFQAARFSEDKEQRSLRALFMSDEHFDARAVVRHCRALPGVDACVLLSRNGEIQSSAGEGEADFAAKAASMLGAVISLAEGLGLADAENFSMRTDKGMVSFFRAEPVYLGVQHSNRGFAPGVQEKLALAGIELARMAGS